MEAFEKCPASGGFKFKSKIPDFERGETKHDRPPELFDRPVKGGKKMKKY